MEEVKKNTLNIYQRLNKIMEEISYVKKETEVSFKSTKYNSVSHDTVTKKLHDPLQREGVMVTSDIVECNQNGNRTEVKLAVSFINIDDPKDRFTVHFFGHGVDNQDKGIGKAISYAMKYCLLKTFLIESGTDDDVESHNIDHIPEKPVENSKYNRITPDQVSNLEKIINGHTEVRQQLLANCHNNLSSITIDRYPGAVSWVKDLIKQGGQS